MRITLKHRGRQTLSGDFEPPPGVSASECVAFRVQRHPTTSAIATSPLFGQNCVAAVWDAESGKLLWSPQRASDIAWSSDGLSVLVLMSKFGPGPRGGIGHRLMRYSWPGRELQEELLFSVLSGGADALVVSPAGGLAATIAIQGPEWYYEVLGLRPSLSQLGIGHRINDYLLDGPAFSPDERFLVTVGSPRFVWWACAEDSADEDEWQLGSEGGRHELGWLYVHDLAADQVTKHALAVDLPAGWRPVPRGGEADGWSWMVVWGPQFIGNRAFRIWLPDGSSLDLCLPLPETVVVPVLAERAQEY